MKELWPFKYLLLLTFLTSCASSKNYDGYKVYEIIPETYEQAVFLHATRDEVKFDFWREGRNLGDPSNVMVAPNDQWYFERELNANGLKYKIVVDDVQRIIQEKEMKRIFSRSLQLGDVTFRSFMFYEEHMAYLRKLAQNYPNLATLENTGQSHEGRDILLLRISDRTNQATTPKPMIFVDAGIHCREWISPPVALYIIQQLVENSTNAYLYKNIDWAIVPNLNPDGYAFTQREERLWRKNRRLPEVEDCYGTDLNRNFGYFWMHAGASNDSCSSTYAGPEAFSEPEARAIRDWFLQNGQNVKLYLTFHCCGPSILFPWGYDAILPDDGEELQSLGERVALTIGQASSVGTSYTVNGSAIGLYASAGGSDDWAKGAAGVELSYTIELPLADGPFYFMVPARQILPIVQETFEGVKEFHSYIEKKFVTNATLP